MSAEPKKPNELETFLANFEGESREDDVADLRAQGVDVDNFLSRVNATVKAGYRGQLRLLAERERQQEAAMPSFLSSVSTMTRTAMLECFERLRHGDFGDKYRELALARCRNNDASELTENELRSWLEDVGQVLGDPKS